MHTVDNEKIRQMAGVRVGRVRTPAGLAGGAILSLSLAATIAGADTPTNALTKSSTYMTVGCAGCHGVQAEGGFGPALSGLAFIYKWRGQGTAALASYIRANMPPGDAGSLSANESVSLAKLLLRDGETPAQKAAILTHAATTDDSPNSERLSLIEPEVNFDTVYQTEIKRRNDFMGHLRPVTDAMLKKPPPEDWLIVHRTYDSSGFSPLHEIDVSNVAHLQLAWALALPTGSNGITPLAHDGVLFINSSGTVMAIDAVSGDVLWKFSSPVELAPLGPPVTQPRGMAIYGYTLIVPTSDNHVIALDIRQGKPIWDTSIAASGGALRITGAPIVVRGKIIQGLSGCVISNECAVIALDAVTGKEVWRFKTIPDAHEKNGDTWAGMPSEERTGASVWGSASYDTQTNLIYVGTAQTYKVTALMASKAVSRLNSALYTNTTLALDPDTGRLVWHYQHFAREVWDLDWVFERTLMTIPTSKGPRRVVATMGKIGIMDYLDAHTGAYLNSFDLGMQNLVKEIDPVTGAKKIDPAFEPELNHVTAICPFATGVRNWPATSFDSRTNLLYVPYLRACMNFVWKQADGYDITMGLKVPDGEDRNYGGVAAVDVITRKLQWKSKYRGPAQSAALATGGNLVFEGGRDRIFRASESSTGKVLWELKLDQIASSTPITFMAGNDQYVAVTTGAGNPNEVTSRSLTPEIEPAGPGVRLWVFKLSSNTNLGATDKSPDCSLSH